MLIKCNDCLLLDEDEDVPEHYCKLGYEVHELLIKGNKKAKGEYEEEWQISFDCGLSEINYYKGIRKTKKPIYIGYAKLKYEELCHGTFTADKKPKMSKHYNG